MSDVRMKSIYKQFGNTEVIHGVDLEVKDNEFVVFVGPSGCGKSTLLRLIAGLEDVTSGEIEIDGERVDNLPPAKRGIAMVFQSYALYPHMNVFQNMSFGLRLAKTDKTEIDKKVRETADILQITELLERKPKELSGGQRQRVAIGRAIVRKPKVFLFDEPLSNLDAKLRVQMRIELTKLHSELNATMIYVTHDQVEAMTMADKIVVLQNGYVEQVGAPLDLYHNPANLFIAGFIGSPSMNLLNGKISKITAQKIEIKLSEDITIQLPFHPKDKSTEGSAIHFGVRPEHLELTDKENGNLHGKVFAVERLGGRNLPLHAYRK
jgi:multiple sugar transport system ATP-binding protein